MGENCGDPSDNLYLDIAPFYDLRTYVASFPDVPFFLDRTERAGGAVLELACGTGRVTIPLAEAGNEVWGIDLSEALLARLEKKRRALSDDAGRRLHIARADMCDFDLGRKFPLIIIPFRSIHVLPEPHRRDACLKCVREHLEPEGRFIITFLRFELDESWVSPGEIPVEVLTDPETGRKVRFTSLRRSIDVENQVCESDQVFYATQPDGSEKRSVGPMRQTWFTDGQMRDLITSNGFEIVEEMGDYDGRPAAEGRELILVCKLSRQSGGCPRPILSVDFGREDG